MLRSVVFAIALISTSAAQEEKKDPPPKGKILAIKGARVYTGAGNAIDGATILIENGRISAVGKEVKIPDGAETIDATGKVIIPGLVDGAARAFLGSEDLMTAGSAEHDVHDLLDPFDEPSKELVQYGITTVCVLPMARGGVSGLGVVIKPGADRSTWVVKRHACLRLSLGTGGADVSTSTQRYDLFRQLKAQFDGAKAYQEMWEKYHKDLAEYETKKKAWDEQQKKKEEPKKEPKKEEPKKEEPKKDEKPAEEPKKPQKPRTDPRSEILVKALKGELLVRIEAHTADTIELSLQLAADYKLKLIIDNATEGARLAADIAKAKVPVFVGPVFRYGIRKVDYLNHSEATAGLLAKAGVQVGIGSFPDPAAGHDGNGAGRFLLDAAAICAGKGLSKDQALRAVTIEPAKILGVDKQVGSLEKGKAADLVILSGEPFEADTKVERTMTDGAWVYQRRVE